MASFQKTTKGWRASVSVPGARDTGCFTTKAQAQAWAAQRETGLRTLKESKIVPGKSVEDAFRRYELEVSKKKRGHRWEALLLGTMETIDVDGVAFGSIPLAQLTASHIARLRDIRLQSVKSSTVNRNSTFSPTC